MIVWVELVDSSGAHEKDDAAAATTLSKPSAPTVQVACRMYDILPSNVVRCGRVCHSGACMQRNVDQGQRMLRMQARAPRKQACPLLLST